ncbi:MAG: hypothetical protein ACTSQJ_16955 [Promethearchaeota archaeon]
MAIESNQEDEKNKISNGLIISSDQLNNNPIFKGNIGEILKTPYYLFIFISREEVIKISCFPTNTNNIKKILIKLREFSPDLVKGISNTLKELNLSKDILHTTGLCYEMENCFYETYIIGDNLESDNINKDAIKDKFNSIAKVVNVDIEDIPTL